MHALGHERTAKIMRLPDEGWATELKADKLFRESL